MSVMVVVIMMCNERRCAWMKIVFVIVSSCEFRAEGGLPF